MPKKDLYLECYSGISGDMTVAALLDLGANEEKLVKTLKELGIEEEYEIKISKVLKGGIECKDFDVVIAPPHLHDHHHKLPHELPPHKRHEHEHVHRNLDDIFKIIDKLSSNPVKDLAKKIFMIVAEAEAKAHGKDISEVHFHEVGAIDSIIDIVSAAFCIVDLDIKDIYISPLYEGSGFVRCAHGMLPVPVPAVLNIVSSYDITIKITNHDGELITPTGAAIVAALKPKKELKEQYVIKKVGLGAGKKYPDKPSMLRAMLIEERNEVKS